MEQQNKIYTVVGATGTGKTPFIIGGDFEEGMAKIFLDKGMSTLIIDELEHPKYQHFRHIKPDQYKQLSSNPGYYRTLVQVYDMKQLVRDIAFKKQVHNTLLVFEDAKKWISSDWKRGEMIELNLIGNSKQQNVDIVFMFWSWRQIPKDLCDMTKYYIIFNTASGPSVKKDELGDSFDDCMEAHNLIRQGKFVNNKPYYIVKTGIN